MKKLKLVVYEVKQILHDIWNGKMPPCEIPTYLFSLVSWLGKGTFFLNIVSDGEAASLDMGVTEP